MTARWLSAILLVLVGCDRRSNSPSATSDADLRRYNEGYEKRAAEHEAQLKRMAEQLRVADEQQAQGEAQLRKEAELQARYEAILARWEKQAARFDALLDKRERTGPAPASDGEPHPLSYL